MRWWWCYAIRVLDRMGFGFARDFPHFLHFDFSPLLIPILSPLLGRVTVMGSCGPLAACIFSINCFYVAIDSGGGGGGDCRDVHLCRYVKFHTRSLFCRLSKNISCASTNVCICFFLFVFSGNYFTALLYVHVSCLPAASAVGG